MTKYLHQILFSVLSSSSAKAAKREKKNLVFGKESFLHSDIESHQYNTDVFSGDSGTNKKTRARTRDSAIFIEGVQDGQHWK